MYPNTDEEIEKRLKQIHARLSLIQVLTKLVDEHYRAKFEEDIQMLERALRDSKKIK